MKTKKLTLIFLLLLLSIYGHSQQIVFDRGVRIGELTAFPDVSIPTNYYYLPDKIQLATQADGTLAFSFLRYVRNAENTSSGTISESNDAGGIIHAVVNLSIPAEQIRSAERELQKKIPGAKLMGGVMYKSGKIALISSIIGSDGTLTKKVVGLGSAPVLEGQKAAVSVLLTKQGADILRATFKTPTPDLSFQFEMDSKGYQSPKSCKIEADFEQIYSNKTVGIAAVSPVFAAEIQSAFEDLSNSGAIKVTQIGEDAELNKMRETAYNQLVNLMFDRVGGQGEQDLNSLRPDQQRGLLDRATDLLNHSREEAIQQNERARTENRENANAALSRERVRAISYMDSVYRTRGIRLPPSSVQNPPQVEQVPVPSFAITASFVQKKTRRTGKYVVDLNKYTEDQRTFTFSENVGNVMEKCPKCFVDVNIDDPLYKQRDVIVKLVGIATQDFDTYINSVEVVMRKKHENNDMTLQSLLIDKVAFNAQANNFKMQYGWKDDNNRTKWLKYDYKTKWTFQGGMTVETDWKQQEFSAISLVPPMVKKDVYVEIDPTLVQDKGFRAAEVRLYYKNGESELSKTLSLKSADNILSKSAEIILPQGIDDYMYDITWFVKGKQPFKTTRIPYNAGTLFLETIPQ